MSGNTFYDETCTSDVFDSRYYKVNKVFMTAVGTWPHQSNKDRYFRVVFITCWLASCMIPQINFAVRSTDNWDAVIECATPFMTLAGALIKYYTCVLKVDKFAQTMNYMRRNWEICKTLQERRILGYYALIGKRRTLIYIEVLLILLSIGLTSSYKKSFLGYLYAGTQIYSFVSIVPQVLDVIDPLNESRPLRQIFLVDFGVDQEKNFLLIWAHCYITGIIAVSVIAAHDTMHGAYIEHACSIFGILGHRLHNVVGPERSTTNFEPVLEEDVDHQKVIACIRTHNEILEFSAIIQNIYSEPFLWQLVLGAVIVSLGLVQCVLKVDKLEELSRFVIFVAGHILHLFFNSVPGQRLMDHSQAVSQSAGSIAWYNMSLRARKLLPMIYIRSGIPCCITAGKFYIMCMENFCTVIQSSMSYFMVLTSAR